MAVSFPKNATDMEMARQLCTVAAAGTGHRPGLIAKMERAEAIPHLEDILRVSRRHHGRPRRSGGGSGQRRRARAAKK